MGKPVDARDVEYAYLRTVDIIPNKSIKVQDEDGNETIQYQHQVTISYELLDENSNFIKYATTSAHTTEPTESMDSVADANSKIKEAMWEWVRMDKIHLSGYDIGEDPNQS